MSTLFSRHSRRSLTALALISGGAYFVDETYANILSRSLRVFVTGGQVLWDHHLHWKGVEKDDPDYRFKLRNLNQRIAQRLLHLCYENGGIYTKFGQQLATLNHGLPKEYTETLAKLQDQAKPVSFDKIRQSIEAELGRSWDEIFKAFDPTPIASASLAQVHHAVDTCGQELAVKVQYPHLELQMSADLKVIKWAFQVTEYFFPDVQIQWLLPEFRNSLLSELDFENEKNNSRRFADYFKHNSNVHVPLVYDHLSTKRMMTMEYINAPKISQIESIKALNLDPIEVARVLCEVFSEMVFCHGFVHCDPHAGNIFVRQNPDIHGKYKAQLVLLDHGLYRELDDNFRKTYCDLWRAMLMRDNALLKDCGRLDASMSELERQKLSEELKKLRFSSVTDFLEQLPRDMLFVFRTNNMIRALNKDLGGTTRERFSIMGTFAISGHSSFYYPPNQGGYSGLMTSIVYWWHHLNLVFRLRAIDRVTAAIEFARGKPPAKVKHAG
ncbi:atypical abc1 protein kinase [Plasmopara halstedii]|uniref:Atypical abc1 protein kinase n=1 Tax=Plasmopara halstedii TaxID=4781 RepID=A0A0P1AIG5_PLAHL|nr:atypical abc1 protein kinase [Plasmopara halstedii]CEG40828.1 atypical abc1 protein kinase [Plasmopara halstedii]|eukprot:XP_024577197.1 atypical abc1 protein kinase [Plasmopara halstedii]